MVGLHDLKSLFQTKGFYSSLKYLRTLDNPGCNTVKIFLTWKVSVKKKLGSIAVSSVIH